MKEISQLADAANYLVRFGFLGVGLFCILILTPFFLTVLKSRALGLSSGILGLILVFVFAAFDFLHSNFPGLLPQRTLLVGGNVRQLDEAFILRVLSDLPEERVAYIRREFDQYERTKVNHPFFFLVSERRLPTCLALEVSLLDEPGKPPKVRTTGGEPLLIQFAPNPSDVRSGVRYDIDLNVERNPARGEVRRRSDSQVDAQPIPIYQLGENERSCRPPTSAASVFWFFGVAWAQGRQQPSEDLATRLESPDPIVRRSARIDLTEQGTRGFDTIFRLLGEPNYRLQIGAATALATMPDDVRRQMPSAVRQRLAGLLSHPDETMRDTVRRALPNVTTESNVNRPGGDISINPISYRDLTLQSCQRHCLADGECRAYTFVAHGSTTSSIFRGGAECWLKDIVPRPVPAEGHTSGVLQ